MPIKEVFQTEVKAQLAKSNGTKWGNDESVAVIMALITDETGSDDTAKNAEFVEAVKKVVNPSAFAQALEGAKMLKRVGRGEKVKSTLMDFGTKA